MKISRALLPQKSSYPCNRRLQSVRRAAIVLSVLLAVGCSSNDDGADSGEDTDINGSMMELLPEGVSAFAAARTPEFDAGQIEQVSLQGSMTFPATTSDLRVATDGTDVYQIGRFGIESITRFAPSDLTTPIYQYSVAQGGTPNTQDIVFVDDTKAYVTQLGAPSILIVNPSAASEAEFITGSIDVSGYDPDGIPEVTSAVVANGQLFVLMQRLTGFAPEMTGAVAVFDIATDTEIDTNPDVDGLNGIVLNSLNPDGIQYVPEFNEVVVTGRGNLNVSFNQLPGDPYQGAIESIDVDSFTLDTLIDDDELTDDVNQPDRPFIFASLIASADRGYLIASQGFSDNTLRSFNATTGVLDDDIVSGLQNVDLTTLALDPAGRVWVGMGGDEPGFVVLDPATNEVVFERVATEFVPDDVAFTQ